VRRAAATHAWSRLSTGWDLEQGIGQIVTADAGLGFEPGALEVNSGIAILVGVNSAGKSRLVRDFVEHVNGRGTGSVSATWLGEVPARAIYVDIAELVERQRITFASTPDIDDLREQAGSVEFRPAERAEVQYILGREYSSIAIAEVENPSISEHADSLAFRPEVVPYFRVTTGGETRDFSDLSRGELAVLTLSWALRQMEAGSLLVLDEPDCFLSPAAAGRALDFVATSTHQSRTTSLVSSHSYLGVQQAPPNTHIMVRLQESGKSYLARPDESTLWNTLGIAAPRKIAIVVEDRAAKLIVDALLARIDFAHADVTEVWIGGDSATVLSITKVRSAPQFGMRITGVVDGDERSSLRQGANGVALPSSVSPEAHAIDLLRATPDRYYPGKANIIVDKLNSTVGIDVHDRLEAVATALGVQSDHLLCHVWMSWLDDDDGAAASAELLSWIQSLSPP